MTFSELQILFEIFNDFLFIYLFIYLFRRYNKFYRIKAKKKFNS